MGVTISHKAMNIWISLFVGVAIFSLFGWLATLSPKVPYNVRELFATNYPLLTLFVFSSALYWCFGVPVWLASWITTGNWIKVILFPFWVILHGAIAYGLLRISVPIESIGDIVGSPTLNWPGEWELLGRFIALFGIFSLFLTGGAFVSLLQSYSYFFKWRIIWRWIVNVVVLLPIGYWIVVRQANTDNLIELMRGGGNWISILLLSSWIFIIACSTSTFLVHTFGCRRYSFVSVFLFGVLSFPIGYLALQIGTEDVIYKYDTSFSAMQFLFSPNRSNLVGREDLIFRYIIFHIFTVGMIAITQYPFWSLMCKEDEANYCKRSGSVQKGNIERGVS